MAFSFKSQIFSLTLIFLIAFATSARILDEVAAPVPVADAPAADEAPGTAAAASGSGVAGAATGTGAGAAGAAASTGGGAAGVATPTEGGATDAATSPEGGAAGAATSAGGGAAGAAATKGGAASASALAAGEHPDLVFYMHDILGGSDPTAKAITGVVTNPAVSGQVPFAKPNGAVLPTNNGLPQNNANSGIINNDNVPFLTGLGGVNQNVMQNNNNGNNFVGGNGFPVVNGGQLSAGTTLQKLMFGTMIAVDDELTHGHARNSGMIGRAQGFYVYSSVDGKTQTVAFTAMFIEGGYHNSLNFFGVHQTVNSESVVAIMGGTGKYVNAKGFAVLKTLPPADQHETDGLQTVLEIAVFLTE